MGAFATNLIRLAENAAALGILVCHGGPVRVAMVMAAIRLAGTVAVAVLLTFSLRWIRFGYSNASWQRIKDLAHKTPILRPVDFKLPIPVWVIADGSAFSVGALYGQGPEWQTCRPAGFMSKKFTSAQRSYRTFEHEALAVIEALMKWEDKLISRQFCIVTNHEALETIKTSNRDGKSGRLICWDEYLSRFHHVGTTFEQ